MNAVKIQKAQKWLDQEYPFLAPPDTITANPIISLSTIFFFSPNLWLLSTIWVSWYSKEWIFFFFFERVDLILKSCWAKCWGQSFWLYFRFTILFHGTGNLRSWRTCHGAWSTRASRIETEMSWLKWLHHCSTIPSQKHGLGRRNLPFEVNCVNHALVGVWRKNRCCVMTAKITRAEIC